MLNFSFPTGDGSALYHQMMRSYSTSLAPGTATNRATQARTYLKFTIPYQVTALAPSVTHVCLYTQYLINSFAAPRTVRNYISGARSWLLEHGGDVSSFESPVAIQLLKGLVKQSQHVPLRAEPLSWVHIRHIIDVINTVPGIPASAKPCILIGYHTFLRLSNLLSPSTRVWGGPHTLLAKHLRLSDRSLHVSVMTTKTKSDPVPVTTVIPWNNDPVYCPAQAWFRYATLLSATHGLYKN